MPCPKEESFADLTKDTDELRVFDTRKGTQAKARRVLANQGANEYEIVHSSALTLTRHGFDNLSIPPSRRQEPRNPHHLRILRPPPGSPPQPWQSQSCGHECDDHQR